MQTVERLGQTVLRETVEVDQTDGERVEISRDQFRRLRYQADLGLYSCTVWLIALIIGLPF